MKRVWRWTVLGQDLIGPFRIGCCYLTASEMPAVVFLSSRAIWPVLRRYSWFCRVFRFSAPDVSTNDNNNDDSFITANDDDFEVDEYDCVEDDSIIACEKLAAKIAAIQREKEDKEYRAKRISLFMRMLAGQEECLEFDPAVFTAFVEKVVVSGTKKDIRLVYVLRDGSEYKTEGVR